MLEMFSPKIDRGLGTAVAERVLNPGAAGGQGDGVAITIMLAIPTPDSGRGLGTTAVLRIVNPGAPVGEGDVRVGGSTEMPVTRTSLSALGIIARIAVAATRLMARKVAAEMRKRCCRRSSLYATVTACSGDLWASARNRFALRANAALCCGGTPILSAAAFS
jgi:hypothetical protein